MKDQQTDIQLLRSYLEETLSFEDVALLEKRICTEDPLAELLLELSCDEAIIREWHCSKQSGGNSIFSKSNSRRDWFPFFRSKQNILKTVFVLSLMMFWSGVIFLGQRFYFSINSPPQVQTVKTPIKKIAPSTTNQTWQSKQQTISEGTIEILFQSGVKAVVAGPATFEITGSNELRLSQGTIIADVPHKAIGFTVNTPRGRIVDLGTIFGVEVESSGTSSVQVFKGNVELWNSSGIKTPLAAGKTMRAKAGKEEWQPSEKLSEKFYTVLEKQTSDIVSFNVSKTWLGAPDSSTEVLYVMYSVVPLEKRLPKFDWRNYTNHFAMIHFNQTTQKWLLYSNELPLEFIPVSTDLILARIELKKDPLNLNKEKKHLVTFYQEDYGTIHGVERGYQISDIQIRPDWTFDGNGNGEKNPSDHTLKGTYFIRKKK